ncbi:hypothetical protein K503DRAFT_214703, partial [Rhizopogon vinicolor AM-OR11-026]
YRYSILPALSLDGILHLDVQDRPYTSATFTQFIDTLLDNMNPSHSIPAEHVSGGPLTG